MTKPRIRIINHHRGARDNSPFTPKPKANSVRYQGDVYFIVDDFGVGAVYENDDEDSWVVSGRLGLSGPFSTRSAARTAAKGMHDSNLYGPRAVKKTLTESEARATGESLTDYLNTTKAVRDWCRAEGINRVMEAYVVEGFRRQRRREGLSENV